MDVTKINEVYNINSAYISSISGPNWETTPHKGMQRPTDTEFETIIEDLGKALADAIIKKDYTRYKKVRSFAEERVLSQYISIVSPDRKTLVKEAMQFINSAPKKTRNLSTAPMTLMDYINMHEGAIKPSLRGRFCIELNSGTTITVTGSDLQPNCFEIRRSSDVDPVVVYNLGHWGIQLTHQELAMQQKFLTKLNSTEIKFKNQFKAALSSNNKLNTLV